MSKAGFLQLNLIFCALLWASLSASLLAENPTVELPKITSEELTKAMAKNMTRVKEFEIIRAEAKKLGVRVYLFGGTAAAYAHYEKKQLQHERAGRKDQNARFDSDWFSIYRSTQDADLAVDGPREKIEQLKKILEEKLAHLKGSKPDWDLRSLREKTERQEALLKDPDFELQNSDSHSIGAIEITEPPEGEALVRDLRNWEGKRSLFLEDVRDGVLHFYRSDRHFESKRAAAGENPEIIGVIRYLIKRFQFELDVVPEEMEVVQKIIADFDPERDLANPKARNWVEKHAKKLVMHSSNAEYAFREMDRLGLRRKLLKLGGASGSGSLNWWLKKAALRGFKVGEGTGKTAREHQIDIVSHSTRDMFVYESIIRSLDGIPNILESRDSAAGKKAGEVAAFNTGHYTMKGEKGAWGTGIDIRYHLDPDAREGTDFKILKNYGGEGHDGILILNKFALRVIPESVNVDPVTYFKILAENEIETTGLALLELMRRRVHRDLRLISDTDKQKIAQIIKDAPSSAAPLFQEAVEADLLRYLNLDEESFVSWLVNPSFPSKLKEKVFAEFLTKFSDEGAFRNLKLQIFKSLFEGTHPAALDALIDLIIRNDALGKLGLSLEECRKLFFRISLRHDIYRMGIEQFFRAAKDGGREFELLTQLRRDLGVDIEALRFSNYEKMFARQSLLTVLPQELDPSLGKKVPNEFHILTLPQRIHHLMQTDPALKALKDLSQKLGVNLSLYGRSALELAVYADNGWREPGASLFQFWSPKALITNAPPDRIKELEQAIRELQLEWQFEVRVFLPASKEAITTAHQSDAGFIELPISGNGILPKLFHSMTQLQRIISEGILHLEEPRPSSENAAPHSRHQSPIQNMIRYLQDLAALGLSSDEKSLARMTEIVAGLKDWQPNQDEYLASWISINLPSAIRTARDLEYFFEVLEQTGLKAWVLSRNFPAQAEGNLKWWLGKEPLRSSDTKVKLGSGPTAAALGITRIVHIAQYPSALLSIPAAPSQLPNLFNSRPSYPGESGAWGPGHYFGLPGEGERHRSGVKIWYGLRPDAIHGVDFQMHDEFGSLQNRSAANVLSVEGDRREQLKALTEAYLDHPSRWEAWGDEYEIFERMFFQYLNPLKRAIDRKLAELSAAKASAQPNPPCARAAKKLARPL